MLPLLAAACGVLPASGGCSRGVVPIPAPEEVRPVDSPHSPERDWFEDRTGGSGVDFAYRNGEESNLYTILESLGGGVALFDFDGDGLLDIFLTGGGYFEGTNPPRIKGYPNRLYKNLGGWKFRDVTAEVGLDQPVFYSHGVAVGDIDRDGWPDLLVTGYGRVALYANRSADPANPQSPRRVFREVTRDAGLPENLTWSTSAAFADLDGDGYPELFICQYLDWSFAEHRVCPHNNVERDVGAPHEFRPLHPRLFQNTGAGRFTEVSDQHKLRADGKGLGVVIADLDGDARPDIYVANDASDNHLYLNRAGFRLEECGLVRGVAIDEPRPPQRQHGNRGRRLGRLRPAVPAGDELPGEWHASIRTWEGAVRLSEPERRPGAVGSELRRVRDCLRRL